MSIAQGSPGNGSILEVINELSCSSWSTNGQYLRAGGGCSSLLVRRKSSTDDEYHHADLLGVFSVITEGNKSIIRNNIYDIFLYSQFTADTSESRYISHEYKIGDEPQSLNYLPMGRMSFSDTLLSMNYWVWALCALSCVGSKNATACIAACLVAHGITPPAGGGKGGGGTGGSGGSPTPCSTVPINCGRGYHYENVVCPNGSCFSGCVKDGLHETCGATGGPTPTPDPKVAK